MKNSLLLTLVSLALAAPAVRLAADPAANWAKDCASCHGRDGAGHTKPGRLVGAKDLKDAAYQKTFTDDQAFNDLKNGLTKDGKTKMKPFADKLSDQDIKDLVTYVRGLAK